MGKVCRAPAVIIFSKVFKKVFKLAAHIERLLSSKWTLTQKKRRVHIFAIKLALILNIKFLKRDYLHGLKYLAAPF